MSRFFVESSSDNDEEDFEEEEEKAVVEEENKQHKSSFFDSTPIYRETKRQFMSEKQKRWIELHGLLNSVLDELELGNYKKSYENFQQLQKSYYKASKAIKENGHPDFFIRSMYEIVTKIEQLVETEKELRRFSQDLKAFCKAFDDILEEYKKNPDDFQEDDFDNMDEFQEEEEESVTTGKSGGGGWFVSSDDDEVETIKKKVEQEAKPHQSARRKEVSFADSVEARIEAESNKVIDINTVKAELPVFIKKRESGKVSTTTQHLSEMYDAVIGVDKELAKSVQLELCQTVAPLSSTSPVPLHDWELVLRYLPDLIDEGKILLPLIERLNQDFWARSVNPQHLFTPEVSKLHQIVPKFIELLKEISECLIKSNDKPYAARIYLILVEHLYHKKDEDITNLVYFIIETASTPDIFGNKLAFDMKIRSSLYLCINLAIRNHPVEASKLYCRLPYINNKYPTTQILANRVLATIGIEAFKQGKYLLAYQCLRNFSNIDYIKKNIGQNPLIYPPWLLIEPNYLLLLNYLSVLLLDLPYLTVTLKTENILIDNNLHRELKKIPIVFHPEAIVQRIAVAIYKAKNGDWKNAYNMFKDDLKKYDNENDGFIESLKQISMTCVLLTANQFYDNVSVDLLANTFELSTDKVIEIVKGMIDGIGPIENAKLTFNGQLIDDNKFVLFEQTEVESPLVGYGQMISYRSDVIASKINGKTQL
ncbi:eukaryotic translation initiation factor 3 subunit 8 N-terminus-domain-containing protein [Histomonas meleagridis]|uniref:eukaryotic translation initiation factor 3 subunit 8 N-terminus-domain-containing protein n=1 Tax=Histomonas meleagridis TaxID=135588 RepID=UPI003559C57F|nr:eukaryotic translation initiation factor 3 subunit 8 N-terminus-domain-containing protein [Histomonas meleagridis]KAH0805651.1 eukaryotic translation initiation factor 3 subunit 8 N-terminus-domain-containing protein [Histomonas meleagridis]